MRRLLSVLIITVLALGGLVPAGFMLSPSGDGSGLSVVICSTEGVRTISLDDKGQPGQHKNGARDHGSCPLACTKQLAFADVSAAQITTSAAYAETHYFIRYVSPETRRWISSTLVHGPPSFQV